MALFDTRIASRSTQDGRRPLSVAGHGLELCPGFHPGPGDQYRLLVSVFSKVQNVLDAESNYVIAVMLLISTNYKADCSRHAPATAQLGKGPGSAPSLRVAKRHFSCRIS